MLDTPLLLQFIHLDYHYFSSQWHLPTSLLENLKEKINQSNELKIKLLPFYLMSKLENLKKINQINELKRKLLPFYLMSKVVDIAEGSSNTNVFETPSSSIKLKISPSC